MKNRISLLTLLVVAAQSFAQTQETPVESQPAPPVSTETRPSLGVAAEKSSESGLSTYARNWIFAGSALVLAAAGVIVVSLNSGKDAQ